MEGTTAETVVASAPEAIEEAVDNPSESNQATTESNGMAQPETAGALGPSADDPMLGFLTLLAKVERPACANCESKDLSPMFFCNTCGQAICAVCKQNTHSAKMFSRHDVTSVSPYSKEPQRKCPVHHELCIMFSPANESLLCINCFRDLPPDIRAQCLDLDTAYQQKCERLQRGLKAVGELEVTIKDEAGAYRSLLKELHINAMREESTIHVFSKILQGVITATEEKLIENVKSELQSKEMVFEEKLKTLESLQSNVQAYLTLSKAFMSSASKFELLKLANGLVERLSDIGDIVQPTKISPENSTISSNFKGAFSQSLKELLHQESWMQSHLSDIYQVGPSTIMPNTAGNNKENKSKEPEAVKPSPRTPLPFLGRSQSLVNIPLNLERSPVPPPVQQQPPQQSARRKRSNNNNRPDPIKYMSLPHKHCQQQQPQRRPPVPPTRSKSIDAKTAAAQQQQQQYHDVSQVELFATIQSRQAVTRHNKNMTLTSALVGVRQSAVPPPGGVAVLPPLRPDQTQQQPKNGRPDCLPTASSNSGHLCVVQAMVHQDGDNRGATAGDPTHRRQQLQNRSWEYDRVKTSEEMESSSIELTPDQVRQLIRAISAAQQAATQSSYQPASSNSNQVPAERDVQQPVSKQQQPNLRGIPRNDSFEGHEEAVRMLVDAVREIKHIALQDDG